MKNCNVSNPLHLFNWLDCQIKPKAVRKLTFPLRLSLNPAQPRIQAKLKNKRWELLGGGLVVLGKATLGTDFARFLSRLNGNLLFPLSIYHRSAIKKMGVFDHVCNKERGAP